MTIELRTHAAVERAAAERERIEQKVEGFGEFARRVEEIPTDGGQRVGAAGSQIRPSSSLSPVQSSGTALAVGTTASSGAGGTEALREAFRETVFPHADADSMQTALADELSTDLAAALSPAAGGFPPGLASEVCSRAERRQSECRLLADGIDAEHDRLCEFRDEFDAITDWVASADETPLLQLGFEELRARHDRLDELRDTCDRLVRERQATLGDTQRDGLTGIRERELLGHLYADFEDDHPVLADVARLDSLLEDCQRAVRRHLCARV